MSGLPGTPPPPPPTTPVGTPTQTPSVTGTGALIANPITTTGPTEVDCGPLSFNLAERSESDFNSISATSSKLARQKLKEDRPADYSKLKYSLTKGTYDKLTITKNLIEKEGKLNLESITKAQYVLKEIVSHIVLNDLQDSFLLVQSFTAGFPSLNSAYTNLLEDQKASNDSGDANGAALILINMKLQSKYAKEYLISDRQIVHEFLKNCCDATLTAKINEKMNQHEHTEKGAPLFFFYMIELISPNLDTTVRAVVKCLDNMKITDYDGENVSTVVTYLRTVSEYLTQNNAVPNDFDTMVFDVMKTATTVEFQDEIKMLAFARKREGNKRSADSILDELQTLYHNLVASKKWTPLDNKANEGSAFAIDYTKSTCWNCGKKGHAVSQCSDPKNESAIQKARTDFFNSRNKKGSEGGKGDRKDKRAPERVPPKDGEPHEKEIGSRTSYWCGTCGKWTGHRTAEHVDKNRSSEAKVEETDDSGAAAVLTGATCASFC